MGRNGHAETNFQLENQKSLLSHCPPPAKPLALRHEGTCGRLRLGEPSWRPPLLGHPLRGLAFGSGDISQTLIFDSLIVKNYVAHPAIPDAEARKRHRRTVGGTGETGETSGTHASLKVALVTHVSHVPRHGAQANQTRLR